MQTRTHSVLPIVNLVILLLIIIRVILDGLQVVREDPLGYLPALYPFHQFVTLRANRTVAIIETGTLVVDRQQGGVVRALGKRSAR